MPPRPWPVGHTCPGASTLAFWVKCAWSAGDPLQAIHHSACHTPNRSPASEETKRPSARQHGRVLALLQRDGQHLREMSRPSFSLKTPRRPSTYHPRPPAAACPSSGHCSPSRAWPSPSARRSRARHHARGSPCSAPVAKHLKDSKSIEGHLKPAFTRFLVGGLQILTILAG